MVATTHVQHLLDWAWSYDRATRVVGQNHSTRTCYAKIYRNGILTDHETLALMRQSLISLHMRLNLPNFHCIRFELFSDFSVPSDKDDDILRLMNQTHTHDVSEEAAGNPVSALFGSRTRTGGVTHRVQGRLTRTPHLPDLGIRLFVSSTRASDTLRPPPRGFKPVSRLVEASGELFGPIDVNCTAVFEYEQSQGYKSRISFPIPLMFQEEGNGITHIESAQFSRRDDDEIDYQVVVMNRDESDSIVHSVSFKSNCELSLASVKDLVTKARSISTQLVTQEGEG